MLTHTNEIRKTIKFLQGIVKHVDESATVNSLITLLCIAAEPGIDQTTLISRTGLPKTSVGRHIQDYTVLTASKKPGPGYVENPRDPMRLTTNLPVLTAKGERVLNKVAADAWGTK